MKAVPAATPTCSAATRRSSRSCTRPTWTNPAVGAGAVARLFRPAAAAAGAGGQGGARRGARADRRILRRSARSRARGAARAPPEPASTASRCRCCSWWPSTASAAACSPTSTRSSAGSARTSPELEPAYYDLTDADMDTVFNTGSFIGPEQAHAARDHPGAARDLLRLDRRGVHVHLQPRREALDPAAPRAGALAAQLPARLPQAHPRAAHRGRDAGALPAYALRRPEALLARRRRDPDPGARQPAAARGRSRRAGDGHRHGAPRAAQRAGQHAGQDAQGPVLRVRGQARPTRCSPATSSTTRASRRTSTRRAGRCT